MSESVGGPLGGLPQADRTLLAAPPLELAVAEVTFVAGVREIPPTEALGFRSDLAALGFGFAGLEQARQGRLSVELSADATASSHVEDLSLGWRLASEDGRLQVTLMPDSVVVQTTDYERWSVSLRPVLDAVLAVTGERHGPTLVQRIGLRYIDRFVDRACRSAAGWRGRMDEHLLGPVLHPSVGGLVQQAQQQVELRLDATHGATIRHGAFVDAAEGGATSYLLDIDVFDGEPLAWDAAEVGGRAEHLNRTAASLFQAAVTPEYLRRLQGGMHASSAGEGTAEEVAGL